MGEVALVYAVEGWTGAGRGINTLKCGIPRRTPTSKTRLPRTIRLMRLITYLLDYHPLPAVLRRPPILGTFPRLVPLILLLDLLLHFDCEILNLIRCHNFRQLHI